MDSGFQGERQVEVAVSRVKADSLGVGMTSRRTRERLVERLRKGGISNPSVLAAIRDTPRHLFVDEALASRAYEDTALPIGAGQSISQPYIVARATDALLGGERLERGARGRLRQRLSGRDSFPCW